MARVRIGELLGGMVDLTDHDVEEILHEQEVSQRRFGEIAVSMGLCSSDHVVGAWCRQLGEERDTVDLLRLGVDAQATSAIPAELAWAYRAVPVRAAADGAVIVAVAEADHARAASELPRVIDRRVCFVLAKAADVMGALARYYPLARAS